MAVPFRTIYQNNDLMAAVKGYLLHNVDLYTRDKSEHVGTGIGRRQHGFVRKP